MCNENQPATQERKKTLIKKLLKIWFWCFDRNPIYKRRETRDSNPREFVFEDRLKKRVIF